jgi:hypothetical protein
MAKPLARRLLIATIAWLVPLAMIAATSHAELVGTVTQAVTQPVVVVGQAPTSNAPAAPAKCEGQEFSHAFESLNDPNLYTLVPGSLFSGSTEGWSFSGGAQIVQALRPNGQVGGVLEMPPGSQVISPQVCVTLQYNTARAWIRNLAGGGGGITVAVSYAGTETANTPKVTGQIHGHQELWTAADPFNVQPQTAGPNEETHQVRFVFTSTGTNTTFQLWGLYVDPRMI